ncbi:MAG: twin-arginine translocation signal domain-containing protein [Roseovarius sp.]
MKRRDFLRTVGVAAAATGLPAPGVSASTVAPVARYGMTPYAFAKYTARINKRLTPQMLTQFCGFSEGEAARMIRRLTFENILLSPDAKGVSQTSPDVLAAAKRRRDAMRQMVRTLRDQVEDALTDENTPGPDPE